MCSTQRENSGVTLGLSILGIHTDTHIFSTKVSQDFAKLDNSRTDAEKKNKSYLSNEKNEYPNIGRINRFIVLQEQQWPAQHNSLSHIDK